MAQRSDPIESFRSARDAESAQVRRPTDKAIYAGRIARLLEGVDARPARIEEPTAEATKAEFMALVERMFEALAEASGPSADRLASFIDRVKTAAERLLDHPLQDPDEGGEIELNFNDLFEFMLNPNSRKLAK